MAAGSLKAGKALSSNQMWPKAIEAMIQQIPQGKLVVLNKIVRMERVLGYWKIAKVVFIPKDDLKGKKYRTIYLPWESS